MSQSNDHELGMDRRIPRRDFLSGMAVAIGASLLPHPQFLFPGSGPYAPERAPGYYPPALMGLRGSHPGSFEVAHQIRDGGLDAMMRAARPSGESYDLIVVGGGISGLSAAHFFQKAHGGRARVLVLDNHDDFGGHAKRNEFRVGGKLLIGYGGSQSIDSPSRYSAEARGLLTELGIETAEFYRAYDRSFPARWHLKGGVFFDRETFGTDRLVVAGLGRRDWPEVQSVEELKDAPFAPEVLASIFHLFTADAAPFPGLSPAQVTAKLEKTSYRDYLLQHAAVHPDTIPLFQAWTHDLYGVGIDAVPALDCWGLGYPGFKGLPLGQAGTEGIGLTAEPHEEEPYIFHFPDGNASIARLLVRKLVPHAAPGHTMDDVVLARVNYAPLDTAHAPTRIRLNSTVIRAANAKGGGEVEITYVRGGKVWTARARACVLACWNGMIPYLCPELPAAQKEALAYGVKVPLVYTNVAIRNWKSLAKLGVQSVYSPAGYWSSIRLDFPVSLGGYRFARSPDEPVVLHLQRTPCSPGLPARSQHRAGRGELLGTSFETFERNVRDQLGRALGAGGFDPARDIAGITVNRWPHGYAYEYNSLWDPVWPEDQQPCVLGRQRFGRISIANSDAGAYAYANCAIDQAHRAVSEVLAERQSSRR
ncbi:MAG TPA: NAD(P)/FAD-dependent oxidoreductase [Gemmatimonadales bacterium]|nr:NAD(P)/FAD-dependent oxidoreductase [Gemmatimonadales bacterium]